MSGSTCTRAIRILTISLNNNWHAPSGTQFNSSSTVSLSRIALSQSALHPLPILPKVWEKVKTLNQTIKSNTRIIYPTPLYTFQGKKCPKNPTEADLLSGWIDKRARWNELCIVIDYHTRRNKPILSCLLRISHVGPARKSSLFGHIINPLLTNDLT